MKKINVNISKLKGIKVNKKLKIIIPIVILIVIVGIVIGVSYNLLKPEQKVAVDLNVSEELKKNKTYLDLELKNIDIARGENIVHLMADIYNKGETFEDRMVNIVFLDSDGKEMGKTPTYISRVESLGEVRIDTVIKKEYASAHTFKVEGE